MQSVNTLELSQLTPEQRNTLLIQAKQELLESENRKKAERANYKKLVTEAVQIVFPVLQEMSKALTVAKQYAFDNLTTLIGLKAELYGREQDQQTHTFTNEDGSVSITIGHRIIDGWDDTCNTGIDKVKDFLEGLGENKDADTKRLIKTITRLLSKDAAGNLKAARVLELQKIAEDFNNPELTDAINIIRDSFKPKKTKQFVSCYYRDENGEQRLLALNITDAEIKTPDTGISI